jgi:hypothetical protein
LDICKALQGENQKKQIYFEMRAKSVSPEGYFLDAWGTPYRIDISNIEMPKVWSAGKNKVDELNQPHSDDIRSWQ